MSSDGRVIFLLFHSAGSILLASSAMAPAMGSRHKREWVDFLGAFVGLGYENDLLVKFQMMCRGGGVKAHINLVRC